MIKGHGTVQKIIVSEMAVFNHSCLTTLYWSISEAPAGKHILSNDAKALKKKNQGNLNTSITDWFSWRPVFVGKIWLLLLLLLWSKLRSWILGLSGTASLPKCSLRWPVPKTTMGFDTFSKHYCKYGDLLRNIQDHVLHAKAPDHQDRCQNCRAGPERSSGSEFVWHIDIWISIQGSEVFF